MFLVIHFYLPPSVKIGEVFEKEKIFLKTPIFRENEYIY